MSNYRLFQYPDHIQQGLIVRGDSLKGDLDDYVDATFSYNHESGEVRFPLIICDPPYGSIIPEKWDEAAYNRWMALCVSRATENATICMWGGIGKYLNRPFLDFAFGVEQRFENWEIKNWITWNKKRAYGKKDNYLFTREECLILTRGNPTFNIPLLDKKRGYAGMNKKYPAKSEYLRRTNVWSDITEIMTGTIHPCQKPVRLYQVLIETHSNPGDVVYDPCAGSGTTARAAYQCGRQFCIVEKDQKYLEAAKLWRNPRIGLEGQ